LELAEQAAPGYAPAPGLRPLWLLTKAQPVPAGLQFLSGTERIEAGWWDGKGIRRDYRIATDHKGVRYWVYRDLAVSNQWYCHGLFG
jgi:protein ImuB